MNIDTNTGASSMRVVGLLGGVASGKSMVASQFGELGAVVLDADGAGHEALDETEVREATRRRWGADIFDSQGRIDRRALARIVFAPTAAGRKELEYLEQLTHPRIRVLLSEQAAEAARQGIRLAVLDAPVMLKAGWDDFCDHIVFVDSTTENRLTRARQRGWSDADFTAREAAQESLDEKRSRSDTIIDNSGSPAATRAQVVQLWNSLVG